MYPNKDGDHRMGNGCLSSVKNLVSAGESPKNQKFKLFRHVSKIVTKTGTIL